MSAVFAEEVRRAPIVPLSAVADLVRGVSYPKTDAREEPAPGFVPVLRATNIQDARLVLDSDLVFIAERNVSSDQLLRPADIVVATSSGSKHLVGKSGQLHAAWHGSFGAFCATVRPRPGIHPRYLALFLQAPAYWRQITKKALGVNINNLRRGDLESLELPLPPLNVQQDIVAEVEKQFSRLDEAVANLKRVKANLKRYKAAALKAAVEGGLVPTEAELAGREGRSYESGSQLLARVLQERRRAWSGKGSYREPVAPVEGHSPGLPDGWTVASLEAITSATRVICYGILMPKENVADGVLYVKVKDMKDDVIDLASLHRTSRVIAANYARAALRAGDLLLSIRGTYGRVAPVPPALEGGNITQDTARLDVSKRLDASFVATFLRSENAQTYFKTVARGVAVKGVNIGDLRPMAVPLPPLAEQQRIVAEVERRLSIVREVEAEVGANLRRAQGMRQAVLQRAFAVGGRP